MRIHLGKEIILFLFDFFSATFLQMEVISTNLLCTTKIKLILKPKVNQNDRKCGFKKMSFYMKLR